jgi:hypothetical protein
MSNSISWKAIGLLVVVFGVGLALGSAGMRQWQAHVLASQQHPDTVTQLKTDLQLTPDQVAKVEAILNDTHAKWHALDGQEHAEWDSKYAPLDKQRSELNQQRHSEWDPKFDQVRQQGRNNIRAILTPDQKVKFEEFLKRIDEHEQKMKQQAQQKEQQH